MMDYLPEIDATTGPTLFLSYISFSFPIVASQLEVDDWHTGIGDPNQADALCDRLLHNAHRIRLKGPSIRKTQGSPKHTRRASE